MRYCRHVVAEGILIGYSPKVYKAECVIWKFSGLSGFRKVKFGNAEGKKKKKIGIKLNSQREQYHQLGKSHFRVSIIFLPTSFELISIQFVVEFIDKYNSIEKKNQDNYILNKAKTGV